jgi:hypothetical protein
MYGKYLFLYFEADMRALKSSRLKNCDAQNQDYARITQVGT